jgi:hypothetical protein
MSAISGILAILRHGFTHTAFIFLIKLFVNFAIIKVQVLGLGLAFDVCYRLPKLISVETFEIMSLRFLDSWNHESQKQSRMTTIAAHGSCS